MSRTVVSGRIAHDDQVGVERKQAPLCWRAALSHLWQTPSQVRFAQPRGLALKVSDEFTVPLCAIHHSENHGTGDERSWWQERKIDPLKVAEQLWSQSTAREGLVKIEQDFHPGSRDNASKADGKNC
jgi:hypothetical protein